MSKLVKKPKSLHLDLRDKAELGRLLRQYLPMAEVWAYGSRTDGRSHDSSDLDLVARGPKGHYGAPEPLCFDSLTQLREALAESNIPILIEIRDWSCLPSSFHREIEAHYVVLQKPQNL